MERCTYTRCLSGTALATTLFKLSRHHPPPCPPKNANANANCRPAGCLADQGLARAFRPNSMLLMLMLLMLLLQFCGGALSSLATRLPGQGQGGRGDIRMYWKLEFLRAQKDRPGLHPLVEWSFIGHFIGSHPEQAPSPVVVWSSGLVLAWEERVWGKGGKGTRGLGISF